MLQINILVLRFLFSYKSIGLHKTHQQIAGDRDRSGLKGERNITQEALMSGVPTLRRIQETMRERVEAAAKGDPGRAAADPAHHGVAGLALACGATGCQARRHPQHSSIE